MKIAFFGDSITEGVLGVSYIDIMKKSLPDAELVNYGVGGDTVSSLKKRIQKIENLRSFDVFVLFVGVNDVLGKINFQHRVMKVIKNQRPARNAVTFKAAYRKLIQHLLKYNKKIIIIPPLLLGEDVRNNWNQLVEEYAKIVEEQAKFFTSIKFIDMRNMYVEQLKGKKISSYLPLKLTSIKKDLDTLKIDSIIDSKSKERGLHLTLDGVHINSIGANILARELVFELQRLK